MVARYQRRVQSRRAKNMIDGSKIDSSSNYRCSVLFGTTDVRFLLV